MRKNLQVVILSAAVSLLAGCSIEAFEDSSRFHEDFHYSYTVKPGARLSLENFNGAVEISAGSTDTVDIAGTKYASRESALKALRVDITATPDTVRIVSSRPSGHLWGGSIRYTLRVPRQTILDRVQTTNGSVRAEGLELPATLRTTNGSITVRQFGDSVDAQTTNGAVRLEAVKGPVNVRTTNGSIRADDIGSSFEGRSTNGSVTAKISGRESDRGIRVETTNGHIDLTVDRLSHSGIQARTTNSSITLRLPAGTNATVSAATSHGKIDDDFDVPAGSSRGNRRNKLNGSIGSGGPPIGLSTTNGTIHLRKI